MEQYFNDIEEKTEKAYVVAEKARSKGKDPEKNVDIPVAENLAAKSLGLISASLYPELEGCGAEQRIEELEKEYGKNDERVAFKIGEEIASGKFVKFESLENAVDAGIRVGLAYMTGGIVTAPLEGISDTFIKRNDDGSKYLAVSYAGPIRSAGGTASAMSVLLADYIRKNIGLERFKIRDDEIERYAVEVEDYFTRITTKQYTPERKETRFIAENVPVEITGTPTESLEVSSYKDLERVDTNRIRGGMCLIYLDGLPLKAPKIKKRVNNYGEDFGIENWSWVEDYLELQKEIHSDNGNGTEEAEEEDEGEKIYEASDKFLEHVVAGRPIFSFPGVRGGFRIRYGRSRTGGLAALSFHPATMEVTERFMALGTQLKMEYPGKATVSTPCDSVEGPVVRLEDGSVLSINSREEAREIIGDIDEILFLGDVLVPFGEFVENGKDLVPSPYVVEWWSKDVRKALEKNGKKDLDIKKFIKRPFGQPTFEEAIKISEKLEVPLHPWMTFFWSGIDFELFKKLYEEVEKADFDKGEKLKLGKSAKKPLEELFVQHEISGQQIILSEKDSKILYRSLEPEKTDLSDFEESIIKGISDVLGVEIRERDSVYIGARMGRPEKAERRSLKGDPHFLFPCGSEEGGRMRNFMRSYGEHGTVNEEIIHNFCTECNRTVHFSYCPYCGKKSEPVRTCKKCGKRGKENKCGNCGGETSRSKKTKIPVKELMNKAKRNLGLRVLPELLKSPKKVTGKLRHVEPIEKGLLREKYDLYVNKDGTVRYDSTDLTLTHFKPCEIGTSVDKLRELGYKKDVNGEKLERDDQVLVLKPQDIVLSNNSYNFSADEYLLNVSKFVDELLEKFYGLDSFYNFEKAEDLVGELVIGLAPHTSGGIVGRIIGFADAKGTYAHPYWHAAKRRNCDGDEDSVILLMDALLNFSRQFLPDSTGSRTMDAPLILSTVLHPDEVDDESWNVDVVSEYPLELYEKSQNFCSPFELNIGLAENLIEKNQSFDFDFTHPTKDIEDGPVQSNYVTLGEMSEKVQTQLDLGKKIKSVNEDMLAELLLTEHFIPDIKGNLNAFSRQRFRCVNCNEKFRRVPLRGVCTRCGGRILLTVSEGAIRKYLEPSEEIADEFKVSNYRRQYIYLLKDQIISLFGRADRQSSLGQFTSK